MTSGPPPATTRSLARSSAIVGAGTLLSRITGFLRVSALAGLGFARLTDAYNLANSTPNIVYELLLGGILTATLVPLFVESYARDDPDASRSITTIAMALLAAGTIVGTLAAPWIIDAYSGLAGTAHGVAGAAQQRLATDLLRWFMPQMFFYGVTALATAMLNARRRFAAAAFAPVLNNIVVIAVLLAVARVSTATPTVHSVLDDPVLVLLLGLGTTAGVVAMAVVLVPAVRGAGADFRWLWAPRHPAVRKLARLSGWTVGYVAANQAAFFVVLVLAYRASGAVSVYLAAFTFFQLPHGLLAVSIMTALGPELAGSHQRHDLAGLRRHFTGGLRMLVLTMVPATIGMAVLARPLIRALLDHGDFDARSVVVTSDTLRAFAIGLAAFSVYLYVIRTFSSVQDTRTPFLLNLVENGVNIATAFALYEWRGVEGLGWSWTIAYTVGALVALAALRRRLVRLDGRALASTAARVLLALVPAGVAVAIIDRVVGDGSVPDAALVLALSAVVGSALYAATLQLLGIPLIRMFSDILRPSRRVAVPDA
ncbi:MAG: murein biosynthesis integral membrane protein MurJ [Acidimicrobiia bacterium]